jgi:error-prone DNA polymerase
MESFTHLNVTSGYSFKYGASRVDQLVASAAEIGAEALALTDRDTMAGAITFSQSAEAYGITPLLGVNLAFLQKRYRVILMAQSGELGALYRLLTAVNFSSEEKIIDYQIIKKCAALTKKITLIHSAESQLVAEIGGRNYEKALSIYRSLADFFPNQYLEIVSHRVNGDGLFSASFAARTLGFARDHKIPVILSNAVRYAKRSEAMIADVLDSARTLTPLSNKTVLRKNNEGYLKNYLEMKLVADEVARLAGERDGSELLAASREMSERHLLSPRVDIGIGGVHLPESSALGFKSQAEMVQALQERTRGALNRYKGRIAKLASDRLAAELATIRHLGFESYFLTVAKVVDLAREKRIRVAARGSGVGSIVNYLLGVSQIEPITHGLLMERFCSELRSELPDIDIDVESARRLEVYDAVFENFGDQFWDSGDSRSRTATVSMVERYRSRHAIRDVGKALGIAPSEVDYLAKSIPHLRARDISKALTSLPELKQLNVSAPRLQALVEIAQRLDNLPRNLAMHPCAVLLSDLALHNFAPFEPNASGYPMVQFDKDDVEAIGLLKLDILGVRMQSAIAYSLREISRVEEKEIDIDAIPLDDPATYQLIGSTKTLGIFQVESPGQRELVGKFLPKDFTDITIDISLFRPGPVMSDMVTPFLNARHGFAPRTRLHPLIDPILDESDGVLVFHEQVIRVVSAVAGVSLAKADEIRRALGKLDNRASIGQWFYSAALANGFETKVVDRIWEILTAFASFGFCKAHAAAFALPTYQSAWLKRHHTAAFLAGVLTHDPGMYPRRLILDEARQFGIEIKPIDINLSAKEYTIFKLDNFKLDNFELDNFRNSNSLNSSEIKITEKYGIQIGLADLSGISDSEIESIIKARPILDLADCAYRCQLSYPTLEALIKVGAFDQLYQGKGINRRDLILHLSEISRTLGKVNSEGQLALAILPPAVDSSGLPEFDLVEKVENELEILGMDVSAHLIKFYAKFLGEIGAVRSSDLLNLRTNRPYLVAGVKVALQSPPMRSGKRVLFLTLDDSFGCSDLTFFEDSQSSSADILKRSKLILAKGVLRRTGKNGVSLRAIQAWDLPTAYENWRRLKETDLEGGALENISTC